MGTELMNLVAFQDGDKYGEPITNSVVIAKVYGLRHDNVLQAIDNLVSGTEEVIGEEQLLNFQELFLDTGTCLSVNSDGEVVDGDGHLLKIQEPIEDEGDNKPVRVREHGSRAGRLITDPLYPPTEEELALEERKKLIAARQAEIAKNTLNTEKFQLFRLSTYEVEGGQGSITKRRMYEMNEAGFSLLVMGFTGKKALMFKLLFVREFFRLKALTTKLLKQNSDAYLRIKDGDAMQHYSNELERYREQISTLKMDNRDLWERLQGVEDKLSIVTKNGRYAKAHRAISKEAIGVTSGKFYRHGKVALRAAERMKKMKDVDALKYQGLYIEDLLNQAMDANVDISLSWGIDHEAMHDEDEIARLESNLIKDFDLNFQKHNF